MHIAYYPTKQDLSAASGVERPRGLIFVFSVSYVASRNALVIRSLGGYAVDGNHEVLKRRAQVLPAFRTMD